MAISNGSSPSKTEVYEALYLICQATQQITDNLDRLQAANVLGPMSAEINKITALQLRADIAISAVHNLASPEIEEAHRQETKRANAWRGSRRKRNQNQLHGENNLNSTKARHPENLPARQRG